MHTLHIVVGRVLTTFELLEVQLGGGLYLQTGILAYNLTINVGEAGPSITWVGYNIDQRYEISTELTATIEVASSAGIVGFTVEIISDVLSGSALQGVGLDSFLDLVNPANDSMNESLSNLGFPTREKVLNQTFISFSITQFLSLLDMTGNGNHDFVMTVTDANGGVTVKRLMLSDAD